jgi:thiamine phosphate synthase YjbQ (UPF0047 family)
MGWNCIRRVLPYSPVSQQRHNEGEDNADAHLKGQIMGRETREKWMVVYL